MPLKQILTVCAFALAVYTLPLAALALCLALGLHA